MKRGGKVRRMAQGGMGEYDPFAKDIDYDKEKAQSADTVKRLKGLFRFGEKEAAPVEDSSSVRKPQEVTSSAPINRPQPVMPTPRVELPASGSKSGEESYMGTEKPEPLNPALDEAKAQAQRAKDAFKPALRRRPVTVSETKETKSVTAVPKGSNALKEAQEQAQRAKDAFKPEKEKGYGAMSLTDEDRAANREAVSGFFGKIGKTFKDMYNVETPAERRSRERKAKERESIYTGTTPGAAKGGPVKKMASGGSVDGIAKKGKTQGKVVKMASGGFVKNADGCAQRGKTKAFQVKMSRGGKC
jgi:hypothetical protein